jgi:hypothetical protein
MLPGLTLSTGWHGFSVLKQQIFSGDRPRLGIKRKAGVNLALRPCEIVRSRIVPSAIRTAAPPSRGRGKRVRRRSGKPDRRKIAKPVNPEKRQPRNRKPGCAAIDVSGALQQSLGPALKLQTRVLMRLAAGERGDPLHEIEQAFRRAALLMQDGFDDFRRL